ncbi:MAG: OmpA family protein [Bacteriovoracaceae bacterium]
MKNIFKILSGMILFIPVLAFALNTQSYHFTDSYRYSSLDDTLAEKFPGRYVLTGSFAYTKNPLYLSNPNSSAFIRSVVDYNSYATLGGSFYVTPHFLLGIETAIIQNQIVGSKYNSLSDTILKAKYRYFDFKDFTFSVNPQILFPTGQKSHFTSSGSIGAQVSQIIEWNKKSWHAIGGIGLGSNKNNKYANINYANYLLTQLGVSYDLNPMWNLNIESVRNFSSNADRRQNQGFYYLTAKAKLNSFFSFYTGAGLAGFESMDRKSYTIFAGLKFSPEPEAEPNHVVTSPIVEPKKIQEETPAKITSLEDESKLAPPFIVDDVYFDNDKWNIKREEDKKIEEISKKWLHSGKALHGIVVEGFASKKGNSDHNNTLSEQRAHQVEKRLEEMGFAKNKISVVFYGDSRPQIAEEWKNRKVQIRIYEAMKN